MADDDDQIEEQAGEEAPDPAPGFVPEDAEGEPQAGTGEAGEENLLSLDDDPEPMRTAKDLEAVYDIPVQLSAVLGKAHMQVSQLLKLGRGAVVELDRKVGEAIDIYVNDRLVARGEVVVVEERLGITMTEIIKSDRVN